MKSSGSKIYYYQYNSSNCVFKENASLDLYPVNDQADYVTWINIMGIEDRKTVQQMGELFHIHPLVLEDILNPNQRAKIEEYGDLLYIVLRMFSLQNNQTEDQQVSILLRNNMLITVRESDFGVLKKYIGDKLVNNTGNLRKKGEDYLLYTLLDVIIDQYFAVIENIEEKVDRLEKEIFNNPHDSQLITMQQLKSDVLYMRKHMVPVRDLITNLMRNEIEYFETENKYYLRDLQDHMVRNVDELDFLRDQLISLMDLYYSLQSHKMNNVMKTLTGVSFVLLPLTFVASLYGMNFVNIPRSTDPYGFWEVLGGMFTFALILSAFALRRKWFSVKDFRSGK